MHRDTDHHGVLARVLWTRRTSAARTGRTRGNRRRTPLLIVLLALGLLLTGVMQAMAAGSAVTQGAVGGWTFVDAPAAGTVINRVQGDGLVPLSIVGGDDRVRVQPAASRVIEVVLYDPRITVGDNVVDVCTGTVVGSGAVLTAAHCLDMDAIQAGHLATAVYIGDDGSKPSSLAFAVLGYWVPDAWDAAPAQQHDYALLVVNAQAIGQPTNWARVTSTNDATLAPAAVTTYGYPQERAEGTQWRTASRTLSNVGETTLTGPLDTSAGHDGGPVVLTDTWTLVGIVIDVNSSETVALRMTRNIINQLRSACDDAGCQISWTDDGGGGGEEPTSTATSTTTSTSTATSTATGTSTATATGTMTATATGTATATATGTGTATTTPTTPGYDDAVLAPPGDNSTFERTWARTDKPVADGIVSRTWMWGPSPNSAVLLEEYTEAPDAERRVIYYDKSRMEITDPNGDAASVWYVTNGLLVVELMTGNMQVGDNDFVQRDAAVINVAGDSDDPNGPTYATFAGLRDAPARADGSAITQRVTRDGAVINDASLAAQGVTSANLVSVPGIAHQVASPFWTFMNSSGTVWQDGTFTDDALFENPFYATGYPVAEAYWASVEVGGVAQDVLVQCFERRCLTYTPGNAAGWQVEAGNVGLHYWVWRYGTDPRATLLP